MLGAIVGERESHSSCFLREFRVMLLIPYQLILDICMALPGPPLSKSTIVEIEGDCKKCCAWLPCDMAEVVRPDLVSTYKGISTRSSMCCCLCRFVFLSVHICAAYQHHGHLWVPENTPIPVASSSHIAEKTAIKSSRKLGRRDTLRITHNSDGQELWEISGSPAPKACKHGCRDKITMLWDLNGNEVFELSEEEYSYSESD